MLDSKRHDSDKETQVSTAARSGATSRRPRGGESSPRARKTGATDRSRPSAPASTEPPRAAIPDVAALLAIAPRGHVGDDEDRRFRLAFLRKLAAAYGGECLSPAYSKSMRWRCPEGHVWEALPSRILKGHWCKHCAFARIATINMARGFARVQELARSRGGECLSSEYNHTSDLLRWRCAEGHEWESTTTAVRAGTWCLECLKGPHVRLSIDDMRAFARGRGGDCLSPAYRGPLQPLRWRCADDHEWEAPPQYVRHQGTWCPHCAHAPRKELAEVQADAAAHGGEFLSRSYLGAEVPHLYRCRIGHEFEARPSRVAGGQWCPRCRQATEHDLGRLRDVVARRGGVLLSDQCGQSSDRVRVRCGEGHEWETIQSNLMSGAWCRACAAEARTGRPMPRLSLADMQASAAKLGGECLSERYVNSYTKLRWRCRAGHEFDASPNRVRSGSWCPLCARTIRGTLDAVRLLASERGGECLSDRYQNHKDRLRFRCSQGHVFTATGTVVKSGVWCPICDTSHAPAATPSSQPRRRRPRGGDEPAS